MNVTQDGRNFAVCYTYKVDIYSRPAFKHIPHLLLELARQRASLSIPSIMDIRSKQNKMADPHAFAQLAHFGGSDADEYEDVSDTRSVGMSLETEMRDEIGAAALLELQRHQHAHSASQVGDT